MQAESAIRLCSAPNPGVRLAYGQRYKLVLLGECQNPRLPGAIAPGEDKIDNSNNSEEVRYDAFDTSAAGGLLAA